MHDSFIKLNRKILEWEWYTDPNVSRLFIHCLIKANYRDKKWRGIDVKRGSFITSFDSLSKELKLSHRQIRTALSKLISTNEVTKQSTSQHTVIQVNNYSKYQEETSGKTNERQTSDKRATTTKNNKEVKEVYRAFKHLSISVDENNKLLETYNQDVIDGILDEIENYKDNKKYNSLYLTANNWLKRSYPDYKKPFEYDPKNPPRMGL